MSHSLRITGRSATCKADMDGCLKLGSGKGAPSVKLWVVAACADSLAIRQTCKISTTPTCFDAENGNVNRRSLPGLAKA